MIWTFENYRLDTDNATLYRDDEAVELRPKTFDVLQFLVEHAGELVRKETLLEAVWENSYVVEGVLSTSMSELRKLFGDTAKNQRYISTVYRRGYRFIAEVNEHKAAASTDSEIPVVTPTNQGLGSISKFPPYGNLIGREEECDRLKAQLIDDSDCRLLTLVGPGGIGKSHLAVMLARLIAQSEDNPFIDGFYFVHLQSAENPEDFSSVILEALGLQPSGEESPQLHLQKYLRKKRLLLVIDNFEYYFDLQSTLAELLGATTGIKILLTSRESLHISDAWFHPVTGLALDDSANSDAVKLFIYLAQRAQPEFDIEEKLPAVLRICELIEGTPLAMELAVGWMRMLSLDEVVAEIEANLDILANQTDDSGRHGSMRAVFNETWERLTESERTLMKQLSVFRGGCDRNAIRATIGAGLPILARLVNKALIYTTRENRYYMHELIRQFAEEELRSDRSVETEARSQHAQHYLDFMENQFDPICGHQQGEACQVIQADFDNIRTAWHWALAQQQIDLMEGSIRMVAYYCDLRGHFHDGLAMLETALRTIEGSDHPRSKELISKIRVRSGILNFRLSRYDTALKCFSEARDLPGSDWDKAYALRYLGDHYFSLAGYFSAEQSRAFLEECMAYGDYMGYNHTIIECLIQLVFLYTNQFVDRELSHQYARQAVELARENSSPDVLAYALDMLAWTSNHRGDYGQAEALWREALEVATRAGNRREMALINDWLGWSAWSIGGERLDEARELYGESLLRYRELGDLTHEARTYAGLATVLLEQGDLEQARKNCGRGLAIADQIGRDDHFVYNLYILGAIECAAGNLSAARTCLTQSLELARNQEEQTNVPAAVYYLAHLLYAEYQSDPNAAESEALNDILAILHFLQINSATWQAIKDRAKQFQDLIESTHDDADSEAIKQLTDGQVTQKTAALIDRQVSN